MCDQIKTLAKNYNGKLSFCENCELYQLIFNNIYIEFSIEEFELFKNFVAPIEIEYWEHKNENLIIKRKISIGTLQENLSLIFCKQELKSLKDLVSRNTKRPYEKISLIDIDYNLLLN